MSRPRRPAALHPRPDGPAGDQLRQGTGLPARPRPSGADSDPQRGSRLLAGVQPLVRPSFNRLARRVAAPSGRAVRHRLRTGCAKGRGQASIEFLPRYQLRMTRSGRYSGVLLGQIGPDGRVRGRYPEGSTFELTCPADSSRALRGVGGLPAERARIKGKPVDLNDKKSFAFSRCICGDPLTGAGKRTD